MGTKAGSVCTHRLQQLLQYSTLHSYTNKRGCINPESSLLLKSPPQKHKHITSQQKMNKNQSAIQLLICETLGTRATHTSRTKMKVDTWILHNYSTSTTINKCQVKLNTNVTLLHGGPPSSGTVAIPDNRYLLYFYLFLDPVWLYIGKVGYITYVVLCWHWSVDEETNNVTIDYKSYAIKRVSLVYMFTQHPTLLYSQLYTCTYHTSVSLVWMTAPE